MKSKCHGVKIKKESVGLILVRGSYERRGVCPQCMSFCEIIESSHKILSAAPQLLNITYKGMIILVDMFLLLPFFLLIIMITHVIYINDKIKLIPILKMRSNLQEMR